MYDTLHYMRKRNFKPTFQKQKGQQTQIWTTNAEKQKVQQTQHSRFGIGNFFLIAPFPDDCLLSWSTLLPFYALVDVYFVCVG